MILLDTSLTGEKGLWNIHITGGTINAITKSSEALTPSDELVIRLEGATALPGFINSHDHLDFNLFPRLGNKIYDNYKDWGNDIHATNKETIHNVLKIPQSLRVKWGLYKNLLNGFTTVVNHGEKLKIEDELITVFQDCYQLHSTVFEKNWKWKLNNPFKTGKPFVLHLGEGTDVAAASEIDQVIKLNFFKKNIIGVHGVAMNKKQASHLSGLVWCPASNYFLLGKTAGVDALKEQCKIVFGTDSTLTSSWNSWDHFRQAIISGMVSKDKLLAMLTAIPAQLWGMADKGGLEPGKRADLIVVKKTGELFMLNPEDILLVIQNGNIRVIDNRIASDVKGYQFDNFSEIRLNDSVKKVKGDIPDLVTQIKRIFPAAYIPFSIANAQ